MGVSALAAEGIGISFGGVTALDGVSLVAEAGAVFAIIGPNGAGKTTLFNVISGLYRPRRGRIRLLGEDVTGHAPHELARRGLSRTFQNLQIFFRMSAAENVMVGRHLAERPGLARDILALPATRRTNRESREVALALLERVGLAERANDLAASLPYGALKRLEIARALASRPKVLLLDEPAAGCNAVETREIEALIRRIRDDGVTVILVEHDMKLVMRVSDRIHVLDHGVTLAEGSADEVRANPKVIAAYLGTAGAREAGRAVG